MLRGQKIPNESSHYPLRICIKVWDYLVGAVATLPYIIVGINALDDRILHPHWPSWAKIACLVPFGLADAFNKAVAFHHSNLDIVSGFDSAMSYCYAFEGYKRDKLVRMVRQLRKLFKELHPNVLQTVDQLLNQDLTEQEGESESLFAPDDEGA